MCLEFGAMHIEISNRGQLLNAKGSDYLENTALVMLCGELKSLTILMPKNLFFFFLFLKEKLCWEILGL